MNHRFGLGYVSLLYQTARAQQLNRERHDEHAPKMTRAEAYRHVEHRAVVIGVGLVAMVVALFVFYALGA